MERDPVFMDWKSNFVKMAKFPKLIYRFNFYQNPSCLFAKLDKFILKFIFRGSI